MRGGNSRFFFCLFGKFNYASKKTKIFSFRIIFISAVVYLQSVIKSLMNPEGSKIFFQLLRLLLSLLDDCWPETVRHHALAALAVFVGLVGVYVFPKKSQC